MRRLAVALTLVSLLAVGLLGSPAASAAEPPALGSLSISPSSVNISSSSPSVTVSAEITSASGVSGASVAFESPRGTQSTSRVSFSKVSGTANKGIWEASVPFKQYSATGSWRVASVVLSDKEGDQTRLSATQLSEKGFPHAVTVEGTEDNEPPQVSSLSISPSSINVGSSAQTVTVTAHISDNLSGVASASIGFRSPKGGKFTTGHTPFTKVSGTSTSGTYEAKVTFGPYIAAGTWKVSTLLLADNIGNEAALSTQRLEVKGLPASVQVTDEHEDVTAPEVAGLTISPSSVNTTSSSQTATVTAHLTDNLSGVGSASVQFGSPNGKQTTARVAFAKVSGTETNGTWEAKVPFERYLQTGNWKITSIELEDNAGNEASLSAAQLEAKTLPVTEHVESTEQTSPPALASLSLSPATVNTTSSSQTVTALAEITANASGFSHGSIDFLSPSGSHITVPVSFVQVSGTSTKGIYEAKQTFKPFIQSGSWKVDNVALVDAAGNETDVTTLQLETKGFAHAVTVEDTEDHEPPVLSALSISPSTIDTAGGERFVALVAHVADPTGFADGAVVFESPGGGRQTGQGVFVRSSGTETNGNFEAVVTFRQSSESGTWKVSSLNLEDQAGNIVGYTAGQLQAKGLPATVLDETGSPPTVRRVSPKKGPAAGGTVVTLTGTNFTGAEAVTFGTTPATSFTVNSPDSISAVAPPGTTGAVGVTVTTPNGTSIAGGKIHFTYGTPTITEIKPNIGPTGGGTPVTITGSGFAPGGGTSFKFGAALASSVSCSSSSTCTATTPASSKSGPVTVVVTAGSKRSKGSGDGNYTYT
jgi:hypothetical protein